MAHHLLELDLTGGPPLPGLDARYDVLLRARRAVSQRRGTLLAFGLTSRHLRLVVAGVDHPTGVSRAVKVGVRRRWLPRSRQPTESTWVEPVSEDDALHAVHHAHELVRTEGVAVARSLWSSAIDLAGARRAAFYDAPSARRHLALPAPPRSHRLLARHRWRPPLPLLRQVSAAAHGLPPRHRGWRASFVALALRLGHDTADAADALGLSRRRVQQLATQRCQHLGPARALLRRRVVLPAEALG